MRAMELVSCPPTCLVARLTPAVSTTSQLRTQLNQLQTTHHTSSSELNVIQLRIDVCLTLVLFPRCLLTLQAVENEKRELIEEVERLQQRASRSTRMSCHADIAAEYRLTSWQRSYTLCAVNAQKRRPSWHISMSRSRNSGWPPSRRK